MRFIKTKAHYASNHGANNAPIFRGPADYERFLGLLCAANSRERCITRDLSPRDLFSASRKQPLVDIAAYCLLPSEYHIVFHEKSPGNSKLFLHKLSTAYAMYYNRRHDHEGTLFRGSYKLAILEDESSLRRIIRDIHLSPSAMVGVNGYLDKRTKQRALEKASRYAYSSMRDYLGAKRLEGAILFRRDSEAEPR